MLTGHKYSNGFFIMPSCPSFLAVNLEINISWRLRGVNREYCGCADRLWEGRYVGWTCLSRHETSGLQKPLEMLFLSYCVQKLLGILTVLCFGASVVSASLSSKVEGWGWEVLPWEEVKKTSLLIPHLREGVSAVSNSAYCAFWAHVTTHTE